MKRLAFLCTLIGLSVMSWGQIFTDGAKAYMVGQAQPVGGGTVTQFQFSPSGKYLLFARIDADAALLTKNTANPPVQWMVNQVGTAKTVSLRLTPELSRGYIQFMGDERHLFISAGSSLAIFDIETMQVQPIVADQLSIFYAGDRPEAPFLIREIDDITIGIIKPGAREVVVKVKQRVGFQQPYYSDGNKIKFAGYSRNASPMLWYDMTLNLATGSLDLKQIDRKAWDNLIYEPKEPIFRLVNDKVFMSIQAQNPLQAYRGRLKLATKVCPSDFRPQLSPNSTAVAYVDAGALLVREIKEINPKFAEELLEAAEKAEMLSIAKQVGTALMIYAADMDDVLPSPDKFNDISPYLRNNDMMKSFTYTYSGGPMKNVGKPAETELGYVQGATGRAVVYADGHAKWIPNT